MEKDFVNKKILIYITGALLLILLLLIAIQQIINSRSANLNKPESPKVVQPTSVLPKKTYYRKDTAPSGGAESTDSYQLKNYPDLYLSNQTPFTNNFFSISYEFVKTPKEHFRFTVELKGDEKTAKEEFRKWLITLGFNSDQIDKLDIVYK